MQKITRVSVSKLVAAFSVDEFVAHGMAQIRERFGDTGEYEIVVREGQLVRSRSVIRLGVPAGGYIAGAFAFSDGQDDIVVARDERSVDLEQRAVGGGVDNGLTRPDALSKGLSWSQVVQKSLRDHQYGVVHVEQPGHGRNSCGDESLPRPGFLSVKVGDPVAVIFGTETRTGILESISDDRKCGFVRLLPSWLHRAPIGNLQRLRVDDFERSRIRGSVFGTLADPVHAGYCMRTGDVCAKWSACSPKGQCVDAAVLPQDC